MNGDKLGATEKLTLSRHSRRPDQHDIHAKEHGREVVDHLDARGACKATGTTNEETPSLVGASLPGMQCRATVFVTTRNGAAFLAATLGSLIAQWRPDLELLFLDDGSTDGSFECARDVLARAPQVDATMLRREQPGGMALLADLAAYCRGDILIECDHDDIALQGRLDRIIDAFDTDPDCRLVTSNAVLLSPEGHAIGIYDTQSPDSVISNPITYASLPGSKTWLGATMAFHRTVLSAFPAIDPLLCPYGLDLIAPMRALLLGRHRYIAEPLVGWRQHARNSHRNAGATASSGMLAERHHAFEIMAVSQRLRDVTHIRHTSSETFDLSLVLSGCTDLLLDTVSRWCQVRNAPETGRISEDQSFHRIPPMITLRRELHVEGGDALARLTGGWPGFHAQEERAHWIWTERTALLSMLMPSNHCIKLRLGFSQSILTKAMDVKIITNAGQPVTVCVGAEPILTDLDLDGRLCKGVVTIIIHAPAANRPDVLGLSVDGRLLGIQLMMFRVIDYCEPKSTSY